jgi:NodT family efflux transporter outer membrane factor (OMF) lipoprotein
VQIKRIFNPFISMLVFTQLTACAVGPDFKAPDAPKTDSYTTEKLPATTASTSGKVSASKAQVFSPQTQISQDWWTLYQSDTINQLIQQGLAHNPSLAAASATLEEAQATLQAQIGELLFPAVDLGGYGARLRSGTLQLGTQQPNQIFNLYNTTADMTYTLDIFGKNRRTIEGYKAEVDYSRYELYAAYLTLTSNIVTTSIAIASLQDQIAATKALINAQSQVLKITQQQYREGGVSDQDVNLQQTQLAQTQASLPPLEKALAEATHSLAVLVGSYTSEQSSPQLHLNDLNLPRNLPVSLPSALVQQRPDIQASEALLHVASANIGVATANLLPQVTLSANYGFIAQSTGALFTRRNSTWAYEGSFAQPLFHAGSLWFARKAVIDAYKVSEDNYQQTVLNAFENVANALSSIEDDAKEYQRQYVANTSAQKTLSIIQQQYRLGGVNYLTVLNAEVQYDQTLLALIKAKAARYADTAALYASLGGGWWNCPQNNNTSQEQSHG